MKHTPEEIKYRLSDLGVQIGNIAIEYIAELENKLKDQKADYETYYQSCYNAQKKLEKENAELKKINADGLSELNHINGGLIIENEKLRKENAELREKLKPENCLKLLAKEGYIKFTSDQLTKAKELLKRWLQTSKASACDNINIVSDTEQFLKESE